MEGRGMKIEKLLAEIPVDGVGVSTAIRPGRSRTRTKEKVDGKIKPLPADKKPPSSRKAPSRGRYVDEYARPVRGASSTLQHGR